jgi:tetratricopeptide (TPR) repeat protein
MTEDKLDPYRDDFGLLIEAGFVAAKQLDEKSSIALFEAANLLDENSAAPMVGVGYVHLNKLELKKAEKYFKDALKVDPDHHLAKALLGIAYLLNEEKRPTGEKLLQEAMENTDDPTIKKLVETSMEWAEKDLKKKKAPFFEEE